MRIDHCHQSYPIDERLGRGFQIRVDLPSSIELYKKMVEEEVQQECPGAVIKWKVNWVKRPHKTLTFFDISALPPEEGFPFKASDILADAYLEACETIKVECDWEIISKGLE